MSSTRSGADYTGCMKKPMLLTAVAATVLLSLAASGCRRTPVVDATITNNTGENIRVLEVDYPNASFGTSTLNQGESFRYRFVIQDPGHVSLSYSDLRGKDHKAIGPAVDKGQQGTISAVLNPSGVAWTPRLSSPH